LHMIYLFYLVFLIVAELIYFKIADHFNIIDKPNHRSSHAVITIRGGGIVFPISVFIWFICSGFQYPLFAGGLFLISAVSFVDDVKNISRRLRLAIHIIAMALVFWQLHLFAFNWLILIGIFFFFTGVINAYNFMDGINGITGVYSLVLLLSLLWINQYKFHFVDTNLLVAGVIGVMVFNFFNFRKKAVCFAGDSGSISMAFIICFLLVKLIVLTDNLTYILLLAVYGVDAVSTIAIRLYRKENIFQAHRSHLYQLLVNEKGYQHLTVASLYGIAQIIITILLLNMPVWNPYEIIGIFLITILIIYILIRSNINIHQTERPTTINS